MSRSKPVIYPSNYVPEEAKHYIGKDKPQVQYTWVPDDKHRWARDKAALRLHKDPSELEDEPDYSTRTDMDWDPIKENEYE